MGRGHLLKTLDMHKGLRLLLGISWLNLGLLLKDGLVARPQEVFRFMQLIIQDSGKEAK